MSLTFKQRIMSAVLVAALVPVMVVSSISIYMSFQNSRNLAEKGIDGVGIAMQAHTEAYFKTLSKQVELWGNSPIVHNAVKDFEAAENDFNAAAVPVNEAELRARYTYQQEKTKGTKPEDVDGWIPANAKAQALQYLYIIKNTNSVGEKEKLDDAGDGSAYSAAHAKYHVNFKKYVERFGLYDFFFIDSTGRVVYSSEKEIDFQSNVTEGAIKDSPFGRIVREALASTDHNAIFVSDIEDYLPSYNEGAMFMAIPVIEDGKAIGALAIQVPIGVVDDVFNPLKDMGKTVDGFIIGSDLKFKTPQMTEDGKIGDMVNANLGRVVTEIFKTGKGGVYHFPGTDGLPMTGTFAQLKVPGVNWLMMVGQDDAEMMGSTYEQLYINVGIVLAAILVMTVFGWWLANRLSGPVQKLGQEFNTSTEKVGRSTGMVGDAVASMIAASEETSAQSTVVRKNSSEAAGYVSNVHSAVTELNTSIQDISRSIHETNLLVDDAVNKAKHTDEVVKKLGESSVKISEVVGLINDLAAQTNLLALNAAIEAARAGDAGRGFAVVADEVKKLASHTTQATVDIGAQIHEIQSVTKESSTALQTVVEAIHKIRDNATAVSAAVEEQSGVAKQISSSVQDAASRVHQVDENMNGIEQAANDTGVAADQVNLAVGEVQSAFGDMKKQLNKALSDMGVKS